MGGHTGPELGVKINILVPSRFHVTCIQSFVMYKKIRSPPTPLTSLHSDSIGCIVLLWTCCPRQYVWCFCLFWLGESRFIRKAVQIPPWNLLSPTLTRPFPLDSVVQLLFY